MSDSQFTGSYEVGEIVYARTDYWRKVKILSKTVKEYPNGTLEKYVVQFVSGDGTPKGDIFPTNNFGPYGVRREIE